VRLRAQSTSAVRVRSAGFWLRSVYAENYGQDARTYSDVVCRPLLYEYIVPSSGYVACTQRTMAQDALQGSGNAT
jgi:hypothetical protein